MSKKPLKPQTTKITRKTVRDRPASVPTRKSDNTTDQLPPNPPSKPPKPRDQEDQK